MKNAKLQSTFLMLIAETKTKFSYQGEPRWTTSGWPASKYNISPTDDNHYADNSDFDTKLTFLSINIAIV